MESENGTGVAGLVKLCSQILKVLYAEGVFVTLRNDKVVEGTPNSFALRKRTKREEVSWSGRFSVETDSGVLEMDCSNIKTVKARK